jgi:cellulose biosynthesis protein BcsQ
MIKPHVVALLSPSPGTGKTTLATSLAAVFAAERPVRLVEADGHGNGANGSAEAGGARVVEEHDAEKLDKLLEEPWDGLTLVDGPPIPSAEGERVLQRSELVLVPVAVSDLDVSGTRKILDACAKARRRSLLVLSLVDPRATAALRHAREILTGLGAPLARNPFCQRSAYAAAAAAHVPITTHAPSSIALSEVRALANEIAALLR